MPGICGVVSGGNDTWRWCDRTGKHEAMRGWNPSGVHQKVLSRCPQFGGLQPSPDIEGTERKGEDRTDVVQFKESSLSDIFYRLRVGQKGHRNWGEKTAHIKIDQLEGLRRKEKRAQPGNGPIKRKDHHASGSGTRGRVTSYEPH